MSRYRVRTPGAEPQTFDTFEEAARELLARSDAGDLGDLVGVDDESPVLLVFPPEFRDYALTLARLERKLGQAP